MVLQVTLERPAGEGEEPYDLEDAALGVHVLLTGTAEAGDGPLGFLARAGDLSASAVRAIAAAIESLAARVVRQRLASDALRAVPPFLGRPLDDEHKEWLLAVLQGVMVFVRRAADAGTGLRVVARHAVVPAPPAR